MYSFRFNLFSAGAISLLSIFPLFIVWYPPLHDYPFHMARIHILTHLDDPVFSRFYELGSLLLPNLAMDAFATGLAQFMSAEVASKIFVSLCLAVNLLGPMFLHRAVHGRWSPWPLLCIAILHNGIFMFGFFNYLFGMGMAFICASVWLIQRPGIVRLVTAFVFGILLMFCHMEAFGIFSTIVGSMEIFLTITRIRQSGYSRSLWNLIFSGIPFFAAIALFLAVSPTSKMIEGFSYSSWIGEKPYGALFSLSSGLVTLDAITFAALLILFLWLAISRHLTVAAPVVFAAVMLGLALIIVPSDILGAYYADVRMAPAVMMLAIVAFDISGPKQLVLAKTVALVAGLLTVIRVATLSVVWMNEEKALIPAIEGMKTIEPGSVLFRAMAEDSARLIAVGEDRRMAWRPPVKTLPSYAAVLKPIFVPSIWTEPTQQPLNVRSAYLPLKEFQQEVDQRPFATADEFATMLKTIRDKQASGEWEKLTAAYVLLIGAHKLEPFSLPEGTTVTYRSTRFMLVRIGS